MSGERGGFWSGIAAQVIGGVMLAVALGVVAYLSPWDDSGNAARGNGQQDAGAGTIASAPCPGDAGASAGETLFQVKVFETAKSKAFICRSGNGLWYHGVRKSDGATITLRADHDDDGYVARDVRGGRTTTYRVNERRLTKTTGGTVELDEAVTQVG